jgi:hypothetical protein
MKKIYFATLFTFLSMTVSASLALAQTVSIASFVANPPSVISENSVIFSYGGSNITSYKLSLQCPSGVNAPSPEGDNCNGSISLPNLDGPNSYSVKFTNSTSVRQDVSATLTGLGGEQDSRTITVTVLPKVSASAHITSFTLDQTSIPTTLYSNKPAAHIVTNFSADNVDIYKIRLECPLPTTIAGVEERIDLIDSGGQGVSSPSIEGEQCNITQTGSASLKQFSFILLNPFKTPQSVNLILQAYSWDGSKNVFGDEQSKTITVLPI